MIEDICKNYILPSALIVIFKKLFFLKQKKETKKKQIQQERITEFETHYLKARRKYANDKNVTFDFPYIHLMLKKETIPMPAIPISTEQLLLLQKDHLQITCDLVSFRQHVAFIKAKGKYSANFYNVELPEKIGLGLWQFPKGKDPTIFPVFVKRQIIAGNIRVWNMETGMYEMEMMNSEIKTLEGSFITQHENYCCGGIEFYKYHSCFY